MNLNPLTPQSRVRSSSPPQRPTNLRPRRIAYSVASPWRQQPNPQRPSRQSKVRPLSLAFGPRLRRRLLTPSAAEPIKDAIQSLYQMMVQTVAYDAVPSPLRSRDVLARELRAYAAALAAVHAAAAAPGADGLGAIPPEPVMYIENGRNPEIYTREFVELIRRNNQLLRGRRLAYGRFRDTLADQIRAALPELRPHVDRVVAATGGPVVDDRRGDLGDGVGVTARPAAEPGAAE